MQADEWEIEVRKTTNNIYGAGLAFSPFTSNSVDCIDFMPESRVFSSAGGVTSSDLLFGRSFPSCSSLISMLRESGGFRSTA